MRDRRTVREVARGRGAPRRAPRRDAGPDGRPRAGLRGDRAVPRAGAGGTTKYSLYSPDPDEDWAALGDAEVHSSHAVVVLDDADAERLLAERPHLQVVSAGRRIEMFKEAIDPREFVARFGLDGIARLARARPHADGDRVEGDHRGRAPVLDRARPLPRPQRLALQPQPAAPAAAPRGHRASDGERHGGRGGLPDVAAARGRHAAGGARALPRRARRLLHVRGRHGRRLRRAARPDRLQAGGDGRDGRVGGDGLRVPGDRRAAGRRGGARVGARAGAGLRLGTRAVA